MEDLINKLKLKYKGLRFAPAGQFSWSPETREIFYVSTASSKEATWSLLHETGHALLKHKSYKSDFELLKLELQAWEKAREIAQDIKVSIDEDHIQDCLDTYRDWLYKRSICPTCGNKSLQQDNLAHYSCFNCHTKWKVSSSRFCRAYRSIEPETAALPV